jgi:hypothetical protein
MEREVMRELKNMMMGLALVCGMAHADLIRSGEITITEDAHIRGGTNSGTNYGDETVLWVRNSTANDQLKIYLKTNVEGHLSGSEAFSNATLSLNATVTQTGSSTLSLYGIVNNADAWTESGITWDNAPQNDAASGNGVLSGAVKLATLELPTGTTAGANYTFADEKISEYLNWTAGAGSGSYGYGSSEDKLATFIIVSSTTPVLYRFTSSEATVKPFVSYDVIPEPATVGLFLISSSVILVARRAFVLR